MRSATATVCRGRTSTPALREARSISRGGTLGSIVEVDGYAVPPLAACVRGRSRTRRDAHGGGLDGSALHVGAGDGPPAVGRGRDSPASGELTSNSDVKSPESAGSTSEDATGRPYPLIRAALSVHTSGAGVVRQGVRGAHAGPGAGLAGDRDRRAHADLGAHRLGQDAGRLPVGARPPRRRAERRPHAARLRVAAEGALLRRREEPARAAARDRRRRQGRPAHRRHAAEGPARHGPPPAGHPHHHARVAVPDADQPGREDLRRHGAGDRRRDPRRRADQARRRTWRSRSSGWRRRPAATCSGSA